MTVRKNNVKRKLVNYIHFPNSYLGPGALGEHKKQKYVSFLE